MIILTDFSWSLELSHAGAHHHAVRPFDAAQGAESVAPVGSSNDSSDSYNGDDACHYLRERNAAMDCYSEVTRESDHLEIALSTS